MNQKQPDSDFITSLVGTSGPHNGLKIEITGTLTTIGGEYADIDLSQDQAVSPQHCYISKEDGEFWIYNAEGSKGTLFSGRPINRAKLRDGDKIVIGKTLFVWHDKSGSGKSPRTIKDIDFIAVPPVEKPSTGRTRIDSKYTQKSSSASITQTNPRNKTIRYSILTLIILSCIYAYFLDPVLETKKIERQVNQYWDEYNLILNKNVASLNLSAIREEEKDFDYSSLDSMRLSSTIFSSIGRPRAARAKNMNRVKVIILSADIMNTLRHEDIPVEQYKAIYDFMKDLKALDLTNDDEWSDRRDWFVDRFVSIQAQLKINCLNTPVDLMSTQPTTRSSNVMDDFLSGYYIYKDNKGSISEDLSSRAVEFLEAAGSTYRSGLKSDRDNKQVEIFIILCDYMIVDLRMRANIEWKHKYISSSTNYLEEGYKMLTGMSGSDYNKLFPNAVTSTQFSNFSNFRAMYVILIDKFEKATNAHVRVD